MTQSTARLMNYPIWAHAEYETDYDGIQQLVDSLSVGDVVQINDRKEPLRIDERGEDGTLYSKKRGLVDDTTYRIKKGGGRSYGTYFHRERSKQGVGKLGVIYRADGSISPYTKAELVGLLGGPTGNGLFEVRWEVAETTVRPVPDSAPTRPRIPDHASSVGKLDAEQMAKDAQRNAQKPEMKAIRRYQNGESVEDIDALTRETEFETRKTIAENVALSRPDRDTVPPGALFFNDRSVETDPRTVIPLDALESIEPVETTEQSEPGK